MDCKKSALGVRPDEACHFEARGSRQGAWTRQQNPVPTTKAGDAFSSVNHRLRVTDQSTAS